MIKRQIFRYDRKIDTCEINEGLFPPPIAVCKVFKQQVNRDTSDSNEQSFKPTLPPFGVFSADKTASLKITTRNRFITVEENGDSRFLEAPLALLFVEGGIFGRPETAVSLSWLKC